MKKNLNLTLMFLAFALIACQKDVLRSDNAEENFPSKSNAGSTNGKDIPLRITVEGVGGDATEYKIKADTKGAYVDGLDNVKAVIDQYGRFIFSTNTSTNYRNAALRRLFFYYDNPEAGYATYTHTSDGSKGRYYFSSDDGVVNGETKKISDMITDEVMCLAVGGSYYETLNTQSWAINFNRGIEANNGLASWIITCKATGSLWEVEPGNCGGSANTLAALKIDQAVRGRYYMPFKFILEKK